MQNTNRNGCSPVSDAREPVVPLGPGRGESAHEDDEVHLEGGPELGPTERTDLAAGQSTEVVLPAGESMVGNWTAHPEVSAC